MYAVLASLLAFIEASRYGLLFLGTLFGSPLVMVAAGYLVHIQQLDFLPAYLTVVTADIVGDIVWYWVGRVGARPFLLRYGSYFGMNQNLMDRIEHRFLKYHERILILSKLTMGFGVAIGVLAVAGMMRVPFWRYLAINLSGELLWALIPLLIGFYFGNISDLVPESLRFGFVAVGFVGAIVLLRYGMKELSKKEW